MRISLNWLRDYLDLKSDVDVNHIAHALTMAGLEVEHIHRLKDNLKDILVGEVVKKVDNPNAVVFELKVNKKLQKALSPVADLKEGNLVAFIPDTKTHKGLAGRIATLKDLGVAPCPEEVAILGDKNDLETPTHLIAMPGFDDVIFTLGITPNRADALSHLGVSRELSALMDVTLRSLPLSFREMGGPTHERAVIEINNDDDCPRYALRVIEDIKVEESPLWLKIRLWSAGIRPINNVVDVTNYVMLSLGQPMHAYDFDRLAKDNRRAKIMIKRAEHETLKTLDGKEIKLCPDDVAIYDSNGPIALAGVMGGFDTSVTEQSTTILLESAYFDPTQVRMSARRHNVSTESSYRFERGVDPNGVLDALNYATRLLIENHNAKACREPLDAYRKRIDPLEIKMRLSRAQEILGMDAAHFDEDLLRRKFLKLGIETVTKSDDAMYFRVPTFRPDCTREIDLIEEAARMIGYDKINESVNHGIKERDLFAHNEIEQVVKKIRERLVARGFSEAINYAFLNKEYQENFLKEEDENKVINVLNPLSERYNVMRLSLLPGLIKNLLHNQRNQEKSIRLFEIGTVFLGKRISQGPKPELLLKTLDQDSFSHEKQAIAGIINGAIPYQAFDGVKGSQDFYDLKGVVSECLLSMGFNDQSLYPTIMYSHGADVPYLHPGESVSVYYKGESEVLLGFMGKLHPHLVKIFDLVGDTFVFELSVEPLARHSNFIKRFKNFSRFPGIVRDVALLVDEEIRILDILKEGSNTPNAKLLLQDINVFDIYRGKNIPNGKKSVAISLTLQRIDRTLTDEEADSFVQSYVSLVHEKTGAQIR